MAGGYGERIEETVAVHVQTLALCAQHHRAQQDAPVRVHAGSHPLGYASVLQTMEQSRA